MVARAKIDPLDGYQVTALTEHDKTHQGLSFMASAYQANTVTINWIIDLSADSTTQYHMKMTTLGGTNRPFKLFLGSTYALTSTVLTMTVTNKFISTGTKPTTQGLFYAGPVITATGTIKAFDLSLATNKGLFQLGVDEFVMQGGNVFHLQATTAATTSTEIMQFHWYETKET